ncbi:MAG: hypothetical protein AABY22_32735 [Nanoarchaeota archaeon]
MKKSPMHSLLQFRRIANYLSLAVLSCSNPVSFERDFSYSYEQKINEFPISIQLIIRCLGQNHSEKDLEIAPYLDIYWQYPDSLEGRYYGSFYEGSGFTLDSKKRESLNPKERLEFYISSRDYEKPRVPRRFQIGFKIK